MVLQTWNLDIPKRLQWKSRLPSSTSYIVVRVRDEVAGVPDKKSNTSGMMFKMNAYAECPNRAACTDRKKHGKERHSDCQTRGEQNRED
jgi:hypothetical protein